MFSKLGPAFDPGEGGAAGLAGGAIITGQGVTTKMELGPLETLAADKLGSQKDYARQTSRDLVNGINAAIAMLKTATTARKAIVYIGDGADTNPDAAREQMRSLRLDAGRAHR
ncbi:MAG: hypothetical protein R2939_19100 [Kofleriaceae bacterium]